MSKYKLTLYYSVSNGGDGSAYPKFAISQELAEIHQDIENLNEGWGEDCTGSIELESDSPINISKEDSQYLITKEKLLESFEYYKKYDKSGEIQEKLNKLN